MTNMYIVEVDADGVIVSDVKKYEGSRGLNEVFLPEYLIAVPLDKLRFSSTFWKVIS